MESYLSGIFALILDKEDQSEATIIFSFLESFDRRIGLVDALIQRRYKNSTVTLSRWRELKLRANKFQSDRNHVMHGVNFEHWDGKRTIASPLFYQFVKLSGVKGRFAKNREMTTAELESSVRAGASLLNDLHRFTLHLTGSEHLLDER